MEILKKANHLDDEQNFVNLNCEEQCPSLVHCPSLKCLCDTNNGNSNIETEEIIF